MFENEVNYRLAKFLVVQLYRQELVTEEEGREIITELLKWYAPEFKSVEIVDNEKFGDNEHVGK